MNAFFDAINLIGVTLFMRPNNWQSIWFFVVVFVVCVGVGTWATPVYAESEIEAVIETAAADDDMIKLMEQLVKELEASGTDCDLATKKI